MAVHLHYVTDVNAYAHDQRINPESVELGDIVSYYEAPAPIENDGMTPGCALISIPTLDVAMLDNVNRLKIRVDVANKQVVFRQ